MTTRVLLRESLPVDFAKTHSWGLGVPFAREENVQGDQAPIASQVPFALGVVPWRQGGVLRVTVVVKATFSAKTSPMTPANAPQPYRISDVHHKNQPMARVVAASDRVPFKPRVDVTVLGHAFALRGKSVSDMTARLVVTQRGSAVIDKSVLVLGARTDDESDPIPFVRMPIVYERAYGGIGTPENPIGCGEDDDEDRPNILDPNEPERPAGFGPTSVAWPVRKKRLGAVPSRDVESPLMSLPPGFDGAFFQCAPEDQQIDALDPDAVLLLEGFDPERGRIEVALPGAVAVGAIYGLDAADPDLAHPIAFRADTLHVDADEWIATITFRGSVEIRDESRLDQVVVATGIGLGGLEPVIPARRPPADLIRPAAEVSPTAKDNVGGTLMITNNEARLPALPFAPAVPGAPRRAGRSSETLILPLSSWSKGPTRHLSTETLALPPSSPSVAQPIAMPSPEVAPLLISPPPMMPIAPPAEPVIRAMDPSPPAMLEAPRAAAPATNRRPEEIVDLDRYGFVSAHIDERTTKPEQVLQKHDIDPVIWRKAERFWRGEIRREMAEGTKDKLPTFEEAWVRGWETLHPGKFGVEHYARLIRAEKEARLVRELREQGIDPSLGMRLRRVWRKRVMKDEALKQAFDAALRQRASA